MKWRSIGKRKPKGSPVWLWKWTVDGRWSGKERKRKAQKNGYPDLHEATNVTDLATPDSPQGA